mmetsp:Transcript_28401/g.91369  ORF Transcript_28401/g.91369 Transcript_28401/m.91369 type:complete len:134 (+) Transcript_28401:193-594(+)
MASWRAALSDPLTGAPLADVSSSRSTAERGRSPSAPPRPPRQPRARRGRLVRDGVAQLDGADRMDIKSGSGGGLSIENCRAAAGALGALWAWPVPCSNAARAGLHEPASPTGDDQLDCPPALCGCCRLGPRST